MSVLSGKADLMDHIFGLGGYYNKDGKKVKFGDKGVSVYYSDLLQDFEAFKEKTGGVIYQHKKVELQKWFRNDEFDFIKKHCKGFDYTICPTEEGKLVKLTDYSFTYYGKLYDFKELKKKGIWIEVPIKFNTLLDLLPYLPYIVSASYSSDNKQYVVISAESYVDEHRDEAICKFAHKDYMFDDYKKKLADLYLDVCKRYFLYDLDNRTKLVKVKDLHKNFTGTYSLPIKDHIDYMHDIEFVFKDNKVKPHWTSPVLAGKGEVDDEIVLSKEDVEDFLAEDIEKGNLMIKYVTKPKNGFPLWIN